MSRSAVGIGDANSTGALAMAHNQRTCSPGAGVLDRISHGGSAPFYSPAVPSPRFATAGLRLRRGASVAILLLIWSPISRSGRVIEHSRLYAWVWWVA